MRKPKLNHRSFILFGALLLLTVILVVGGLYTFMKPGSSTTVDGNTVSLVGEITSTTCPGNPDAGCSIAVNGYAIPIVHGFSNTPDLGTVTGYTQGEPLIGKTAHVYAQRVDGHDATIFTASKYYVHISN